MFPVQRLEVTLTAEDTMYPVGIISSVVGNMIVVQVLLRHNLPDAQNNAEAHHPYPACHALETVGAHHEPSCMQ